MTEKQKYLRPESDSTRGLNKKEEKKEFLAACVCV